MEKEVLGNVAPKQEGTDRPWPDTFAPAQSAYQALGQRLTTLAFLEEQEQADVAKYEERVRHGRERLAEIAAERASIEEARAVLLGAEQADIEREESAA